MLEVYIKTGCPYCEKQITVLEKKGVEYKLYNVGDDRKALEKARVQYGANKVPVVVEDGAVKSIGFGGGG